MRIYFLSFLKRAIPGLFFIIFLVFFTQTSIQFLQQINMKRCPSSIHWWDLNSRPSDHESPSITTRPGLPPNNFLTFLKGANPVLFSFIFQFFSKTNFTVKTVGFSMIRTQIVRVEGEHADH